MKLLLDINVLLDVILNRDPWSDAAAQLLATIESGNAEGFVAAHTLPTIYYIVAQGRDRKTAATAVTDLLRILDMASPTREQVQQALSMPINDFEDALQATAALQIGADYLVTRDKNSFRSSPVSIVDPPTLLALL